MESEVFGHEAGAFTDARQRKQGLIELGAGGTVLLDEISLLPVELPRVSHNREKSRRESQQRIPNENHAAMSESEPKIIAYLNPMCPWTHGVLAFLKSNELRFEFRDIMRDPAQYEEMVKKSGQYSSPCVEIDGHMLADVGGDEVEDWMRQQGYVSG
jgi:monothiol glutaredoxin